MTPKKLPLLLLTVFFISCSSAFSQKFFEMMEDESVNYYDVQKEAYDYFKIHGIGRGTLYKQFKRWEANMQYYIDEQGNRISTRHIDETTEAFKAQYQNSKTAAAKPWTELGPWNWKYTSSWAPGLGRLEAIRIDGKDHKTMYAGSPQGGAWKTTDGGASWKPLTDFISSSALVVFAIGMADGSPDTVYIGNGAGIFYSYNGGQTLTNVSVAGTARRIEVNPVNHNIVLAATTSGIFKSTNAGKTWTSVKTGAAYDLRFKPGDPNTVYAVGTGFLRSTDGGNTFNSVTMGSTGQKRLAVTAANPNYVYVAELGSGSAQNFYRSTDAGATFQTRLIGSTANATAYGGYSTSGTDDASQGSYNFCFTASPTDPEEVHLGCIITWKSTNGATSFTATTQWTYPNSTGYTHCDMHCLEYVGNTLYTGSDGGIFKSTDKGDNFTNISQGLGIRMFYRLGLSVTDPALVVCGAQDNGCSLLKSTGWIDWLGADGMECAIDPVNSNLIYGSSQNGSFYKSTNGGTSQSGMNVPGSAGVWTAPFAIDKNSALYAGEDEIYKSTNAGSSWTKISNVGSGSCNYIEVAPSDPKYIYLAKGANFWRTSDGGATWTPINAGLSGTINRFSVHNSSPTKIAVAVGNKVYTSTNGGTSWTDYSGNLPATSNRCIVYENGPKEGIYVGKNAGIYYRDNTMSGWVLYDQGLPPVAINELEIQYSSGKIRAATYGRGIWECDTYTPTGIINTHVSSNLDIHVFPNPSHGIAELSFNSPAESTYVLEIRNALGQFVYRDVIAKCSGAYTHKVDLTKYGKGMYLLNLIGPTGTVSKEIIIE